MSVKIEKEVLANGLTLIFEHNREARSSAVGYFVRTGARDEEPEESGVSHFLEHMVFKGTPTKSSMDITYELGNLGAQANAYTSEEATVYHASIIPEAVEPYTRLLSDMIRPALAQEEFDVEKNVILEEIALYQDRPQFYLFDNALTDYFHGHTAGNSILGTVESITQLKRGQMAAYHERRYVTGNMALVVSGQFDRSRVREVVSECTASWQAKTAPRIVKPFQPSRRNATYKKAGLNQLHLLSISEGASTRDEKRIALSVLALILGDATGSRLYWELVHTGLVESAFVDSDERDGTGCFFVYAACDPANEQLVKKKIDTIMASAREFTEEELHRAKTKLCSRIVLQGETPLSRLMALGSGWLSREEVVPLDVLVERVKQVSAEDIKGLFDRYRLQDWSEYRLIPG
jgi:predicted Zn-dependent peptidase